ncbi:hypothetical protein ACJMK2_041654 [Sinanodonta woodiana]|uniref:Uncharacterized protein n=1 Tax=Sinanodonta woodiana TaxID=1069815 RepID=A0ABD3W7S6_SINWO
MADNEVDLHPTRAKLLFALIVATTVAQVILNNGIFGLAFIAFVLDLGIGGYICYRMLINGDTIAWIWHNKHSKRALSVVYIISQLLAGIGFFVTVGNYAYVGWSSIVFSLPGAALICIILTAIALCLCVVFCGAKYA